jgi:AraC family transcriptional regulator, regulatory protein of adaptative response / DNA-3-methyladenine glycosylase II
LTRRVLFAKQLIIETTMPMAEVALAAGFNSIRRFNATAIPEHRSGRFPNPSEFAGDSQLEEDGFELAVPPRTE